jgi:hypothetical protein
VADRRSILPAGALILMMSSWPTLQVLRGQSLPPAETMQSAVNRAATAPSAAPSGLPGTEPGPAILRGRLPVQLGLTVAGYYDDNIYVQPTGPGKVSDFIWSISPLMAWNSASVTGAANSVQVVYAPTVILYQDQSENNTVNEAAKLVYAYEDDKMMLVATEAYASFQENNADYTQLGIETSSVTTIQFNYQLADKVGLETVARQVYTQDDPGLRSTEWTLTGYLNYQATPKTTIGLGGVLGTVELEGPDQTYEQVNGRLSYNPDAKLSFSATSGLEFRETEGHGGASLTPDFSLGAAYTPFDGTNVGLSAYRRYDYSGRFYGNSYLATGVSANVAQRFLHRFTVSVAGTFEDAQYRDNFSDSFSSLGYDYFSLRPEVSFTPLTGCELRIFYQYRRSLAEGGVAGFTDDQTGVSAAFTY